MSYAIYPDTEWAYPDSPLCEGAGAVLDAPRGGHAAFQILGGPLSPGRPLAAQCFWEGALGPRISLYELLPVGVDENTSATLMTTSDYESCQAFVTRKAPFRVYDALRPYDGTPQGTRLALYVCVEVALDDVPGEYRGWLLLGENGAMERVPIVCRVHRAAAPPPGQARLGMLNFFDYDGIVRQHGAKPDSDEYWELFRRYVRAQLSLRCTHILLPPGEPVFADGELAGFDFTRAERAGQIAAEEGAPWLCGGHVAHWNEWDKAEYFPFWDKNTGVTTQAGYLQLRRYFSGWAGVVERNGWRGRMSQALADEPQEYNASTYRILASVFRKFLPGVPILDAVEALNLGGGIDIWVPKQDTYEKWRADFDRLKAAGEEMWFYTCAFPAGRIMNRSMDLPLTASRAMLWMGARYRLSGFLHWGFNYYIGDDLWHKACCPHKGALLPAGDAHIVYPGPDGPWRSMRFEAQRAGAEDYELLVQAIRQDEGCADALIGQICTGFREYTSDGYRLLQVRRELLSRLDQAYDRGAVGESGH